VGTSGLSCAQDGNIEAIAGAMRAVRTVEVVTRPLPGKAALRARQQLVLAAYWFSLCFPTGALLGVAVPAQLSNLGARRGRAACRRLRGEGSWALGLSSSLPQTVATFPGGAVLAILSPLGADGSYGTLFLGAAACAAAAGVLIWRVEGVR
jgi:hypothetical protein